MADELEIIVLYRDSFEAVLFHVGCRKVVDRDMGVIFGKLCHLHLPVGFPIRMMRLRGVMEYGRVSPVFFASRA